MAVDGPGDVGAEKKNRWAVKRFEDLSEAETSQER